jgi:hypothetical protein
MIKPSAVFSAALFPLVFVMTLLCSCGGVAPITVSYKWFDGARMLPIEGARTLLRTVLKPNESANLNVKAVAYHIGQVLDFEGCVSSGGS